jgi:hypothetical protein
VAELLDSKEPATILIVVLARLELGQQDLGVLELHPGAVAYLPAVPMQFVI